MFECLQLDICFKFYLAMYYLDKLEDFFNHDVDADENYVLSPREDTTAGGPLFCGSKIPALFPRRTSGPRTFSGIPGTRVVTSLFPK